MPNDLLLLSNSTLHGHSFLEHALEPIGEFLKGTSRLLFAPFALADHDGYTNTVQQALSTLGVEVVGLHTVPDPRASIKADHAVFVGGGNTFRLLQALQRLQLLEPVRQGVRTGTLRYLGSSAGTNHACPTIRTTNDMPIAQPAGLDAFGLVPFQINPHFVDADPGSTHMGESREQRIREFLEQNDVPVLGIREGTWLRRQHDTLTLHGQAGAILFQRGRDPEGYEDGDDLSFLLQARPNFDAPV